MTGGREGTERLPWLKWIDRLSAVMAVVGGVATVGLMVNVIIDVTGRYFFHQPLRGTLELTQYGWMPTLVSLGLGYALLRGEHIRVNLLTAPTRPRTQRVIEISSMTFTLVTIALFAWLAAEKARSSTAFRESVVSVPWLEVWPFRWILVIGLMVLLLQTFATLARAITVEEFHASDEDEGAAALEAEEVVLDERESRETAGKAELR